MNKKREQYPFLFLGRNYLSLNNMDRILQLDSKILKEVLKEIENFCKSETMIKLIKRDIEIESFEKTLYLKNYYRLQIKVTITYMKEIKITFISCYQNKSLTDKQKNNPYVRNHFNFGMGTIEED